MEAPVFVCPGGTAYKLLKISDHGRTYPMIAEPE